MKRSLFKTFLVILLAVFLAACNSGNGADSQNISVEEEFGQYRKAVIEPLEERSVEYAEMFNHYASIIEETEEAHRYLEEEVVPFAEESKKIASDTHKGLVNEEIRELNDTTVEYLDLTLDSLQKSMDLLAIELSPVTEETYQKAVKIHEENMELQEKIDQTGAEMDRQIDDLANEQ